MSIDWTKVEQKPDKEFKVVGKVLIDFKNRITNQEKEIASLKEEVSKLSKTKTDNEASIKDMKGKIEKNEATIADNTNTIATLNGKVDGLQASLDKTIGEKDRQIKELMEEKNSMKEDLEGQIRGHESDKSVLQDSESSLKQQLAEMHESHQNKIADMETDHQNQIADLQSRCDALEEEKLAIQKERDELAQKLQYMDDQLKGRDFDYFKKLVKDRSERAAKANVPRK